MAAEADVSDKALQLINTIHDQCTMHIDNEYSSAEQLFNSTPAAVSIQT